MAAASPRPVFAECLHGITRNPRRYCVAAEADGAGDPFLFIKGLDLTRQLGLVSRLVDLRRDPESLETFGEDRGDYAFFVGLYEEDALDDQELSRAIQLVESNPDAAVAILDRVRRFTVANARVVTKAGSRRVRAVRAHGPLLFAASDWRQRG